MLNNHKSQQMTIVAMLLALALLLTGCAQEIECPQLEMRNAYGCCKDFNSNGICDQDEYITQSQSGFAQQAIVIDDNSDNDIRTLQAKKAQANMQRYETEQAYEDSLREERSRRSNMMRTIDDEYVYGYDDRYD